MLGKRTRRQHIGGTLVAALDIGSHKICCLIGALEPQYAAAGRITTQLRLLGLGHQRSHGIVGGGVVDLAEAQRAVAAAVSQAEHSAGVRIDEVVLGVSCGAPRSATFDGYVDLAGGVVGESDIARLDAGARAFAARDGGTLLTLNRIAYGLDTTPSVREPRGLAGQRLAANHHAVTVSAGPLRNLCLLAESCHLQPGALLPAGYASALAVTTEEERRSGVVCVDFGAGVTSLAGFADGHFIYAGSMPFGGQQVTHELAQACGLGLAQAERIKTLYGSLAPGAFDGHRLVPLTDGDDGDAGQPSLTRAEVGRILAQASGGMLMQLRRCLDASGIARIRDASIVLTGGGSELMGLEAFAAAELDRPVRVSGPPRLEGASGRLSGSSPSPAFSCAVGLAMSAARRSEWIDARDVREPAKRGYWGRVEQWLRESF